MSQPRPRTLILLIALAVLCGPSVHAELVQKMTLLEICGRADKIFRGTVLSAAKGTVEVGGGTLPTVTYTLRVDEAYQGEFIDNGDHQIAEVTMLGRIKTENSSPLAGFPVLEVGGGYVLLTTPPSAIGLSAPVGLGQGYYTISGKGKNEVATNGLGNSISYADLVARIQAVLGQ